MTLRVFPCTVCWVLMRVSPNAEGRLYGETQQGTGVPCEDVTDLSPLVGLQQAAVRRVLDAVTQIYQTAH